MHDGTETGSNHAIHRHLHLLAALGPEAVQPSDPWEELASHPEITFLRHPLPEGHRGRYYRAYHAIILDDRLDPVQERVTLWHELIHAERGHDASISEEEHEAVDREAHARAGVPYVNLAGLSDEHAAGIQTVSRAMGAGLLHDFGDLFAADPHPVPEVARERLAAVSNG